MANARRRSARRTGSRRVSGYSRVRSRGSVRSGGARRSGRRTSSGGVRTVKLVIEQAAPTVQPVQSPTGSLMVPDNSAPKRAKF